MTRATAPRNDARRRASFPDTWAARRRRRRRRRRCCYSSLGPRPFVSPSRRLFSAGRAIKRSRSFQVSRFLYFLFFSLNFFFSYIFPPSLAFSTKLIISNVYICMYIYVSRLILIAAERDDGPLSRRVHVVRMTHPFPLAESPPRKEHCEVKIK